MAVIAESPGIGSARGRSSVSIPLNSTDNEWVLTVWYDSDPSWRVWGCVCCVLAAIPLSFILMMVLVTSKKHQLLLYRMMPRHVIRELERGGTVVEKYENATIFFSHLVGFTALSDRIKPIEFMSILNQIYAEFDRLVLKHKVYKVETIGDAYIVIGGTPSQSGGAEGAARVALFALDAVAFVEGFRFKGSQVFVRAGMASGPIVAGVIGAAIPKYTILGDRVNFASRMESTSKPMKIQCSEVTFKLLQESSQYFFSTEERREGDQRGIYVKGKGVVNTWWVTGAHKWSLAKSENAFLSGRVPALMHIGSRNISHQSIISANNIDVEDSANPSVEVDSPAVRDKRMRRCSFNNTVTVIGASNEDPASNDNRSDEISEGSSIRRRHSFPGLSSMKTVEVIEVHMPAAAAF